MGCDLPPSLNLSVCSQLIVKLVHNLFDALVDPADRLPKYSQRITRVDQDHLPRT